jgi:hypothetical protein
MVNGIDRMDNTKGYVLGNIVSCCTECNYVKRDKPFGEWMQWLDRVVEHRR